ncbi:hypothetical protein, partial [Aeromonas rivipollensis]|uniref:hypothetical protein n=1 Tax=Aeromonas rivipollensis TaxID=948519 RepID=UPI001F2EE509
GGGASPPPPPPLMKRPRHAGSFVLSISLFFKRISCFPHRVKAIENDSQTRKLTPLAKRDFPPVD